MAGSTAAAELKSVGGRGMCNDLRFAMEDEEENGRPKVEHFCSLGSWSWPVSGDLIYDMAYIRKPTDGP